MIPKILELLYLGGYCEYELRAYLLKRMMQDNGCNLMQGFYVLSLF
jgi:hypothetical protein